MLYLWFFYENRFQDMYLPPMEKWSLNVPILHSDTGWDKDYYVPLRSLEGECYISPPQKFQWADKLHSTIEVPLISEQQYIMESGAYKLGVICENYQSNDTAFHKYCIPKAGTIHLGRSDGCELRISSDIRRISGVQGTFQMQHSSQCFYRLLLQTYVIIICGVYNGIFSLGIKQLPMVAFVKLVYLLIDTA